MARITPVGPRGRRGGAPARSCRHRASHLALVHVHLDEHQVGVSGVLAELGEEGADHLARAAPGGGEVDDHLEAEEAGVGRALPGRGAGA